MKETELKINVNLKIIPFGHASIEIRGRVDAKEKLEKKNPIYQQPTSTNPELIEITFGNGNYMIPNTTGGFLLTSLN